MESEEQEFLGQVFLGLICLAAVSACMKTDGA